MTESIALGANDLKHRPSVSAADTANRIRMFSAGDVIRSRPEGGIHGKAEGHGKPAKAVAGEARKVQ